MTLGPIMLDVEGTTLSVDDKRRLLHPLTGGVILFTRNFSSYKQLTELTAEIHALRSPSLLIATDHEGGRVQRFKEEFTCLPAMRELGKIWDASPKHAQHLAQQTGYVLAAELNACGIDLSFTPVLDIDHGQSFVIGDRAFHSDPQVIAKLAHHLMLGLKAGGLMAVGKHFPGHGYIHTDSHLEKSVDERLYVDIEMDDMVPFQQMINFGMAGIMSAHVIYPKVDQNPASFSSVWLIDILRKELKFDGCIFSDDLSMLGTAHVGNVVVRTKAALDAGCDMVLVCNNPQSLDQLLAELIWDMSAVSLARLAHMHGKWSQSQPITMINLRENADYIKAVKEISGIGISNRELPL